MRRRAGSLDATSALFTVPAAAFPPESEAFRQCLTGKSPGDNRLLLARWMTFAFAAHPIVADAVTVGTSKLAETDQRMADLVMALLAERCNGEARAAVAAESNAGAARQTAFEMLGMVASQEVMLDQKAMTPINAFATYLNEAALMTALRP